MIKGKLFSIATAFTFAFIATANAQDTQQTAAPGNNTGAAVTGSPVSCTAKGYWSGNSITLIIRRLARSGVDLDFIGLNRILVSGPDFNAMWKFDGDVLEYNRDNAVRITVHVGQNDLRGKYLNFNAPAISKDPIVFSCNGSTNGVILR